MLRYLTKKKKEARRQLNGDAVNKIYDRARMSIPADYLTCHQPNSGMPNTSHLNFQRLGSRVAVLHEQGRGFKDRRGLNSEGVVTYDVRRDGSFRALTKPRSRVKRLREERRASAVKCGDSNVGDERVVLHLQNEDF